jgi:RimJ/RimL family protein N-acetyltransferase
MERILDVLLDNVSGEKFQLRPATQQDALLLWQWANDPMTRRNSFKSEPILWTTHESWCAGKITSPDSRFWILEYRHVPVGQVRYDRMHSKTAQVSVSIAPAYRGRNFGATLLLLTADVAGRELGVDNVEGTAFVENVASRRAFIKAGFELCEEKNIAGHACVVFRRCCSRVLTGEPCASLH